MGRKASEMERAEQRGLEFGGRARWTHVSSAAPTHTHGRGTHTVRTEAAGPQSIPQKPQAVAAGTGFPGKKEAKQRQRRGERASKPRHCTRATRRDAYPPSWKRAPATRRQAQAAALLWLPCLLFCCVRKGNDASSSVTPLVGRLCILPVVLSYSGGVGALPRPSKSQPSPAPRPPSPNPDARAHAPRARVNTGQSSRRRSPTSAPRRAARRA